MLLGIISFEEVELFPAFAVLIRLWIVMVWALIKESGIIVASFSVALSLYGHLISLLFLMIQISNLIIANIHTFNISKFPIHLLSERK